MTKFISYAQNFEDVMLYRALKEVECGFYIDVGANDPTVDSVTKAFYDRGWRGINIEPIQAWHEKIQSERARDINLCVAAGAEKGQLQLFDFPGTGLATPDREIAHLHQKEHQEKYESLSVPVLTLSEICTSYHLAPIHFLKIDVEGGELSVLQGINLEVIRPWVIVVEATRPNSTEEDFATWEPILLGARYHFVYFDGLNRFYLAEEEMRLEHHFRTPPNFFDGFILYREGQAQECLERTVEQAHRAELLIKELEIRVNHEVARVAELDRSRKQINQQHLESEIRLRDTQQNLEHHQKELAVIYGSLSWRITIPVRWLGMQLRLLRRYGWRGRLDHLSQRLLGGDEASNAENTNEPNGLHRELSPLETRILGQINQVTERQRNGTK
jgi:FkbM family methyltransferase